jgi:uncharacterized membrane protein
MDPLFPLDVLSRFVHVAVAIVLVGGSTFMRFVLTPAARELPDAEHDLLQQRLMARWKRFVHGGIALLLLSGLYNYLKQIPSHKGDALYHALLGTKMLLAFAVFFLASVLVGSSPTFAKMRQNRAQWLVLLIVLATGIVAISGFVKVRGPKARTFEPSSVSAAEIPAVER